MQYFLWIATSTTLPCLLHQVIDGNVRCFVIMLYNFVRGCCITIITIGCLNWDFCIDVEKQKTPPPYKPCHRLQTFFQMVYNVIFISGRGKVVMLHVVLWKPLSVFDTYFNKAVAVMTGSPRQFCHAEIVFTFTKTEWQTKLLGLKQNYGIISTRAKSLWERLRASTENIKDDELMSICFYTLWGSRLSCRLLTQHDDYMFNRLPDPEFTKSVDTGFNDEELRHALAFCIQELDKQYDMYKASTFWLPEIFIFKPRQNQLPQKYFCSEHIVYMFQQVGFLKNHMAEKVTPNGLVSLLEELKNEKDLKR